MICREIMSGPRLHFPTCLRYSFVKTHLYQVYTIAKRIYNHLCFKWVLLDVEQHAQLHCTLQKLITEREVLTVPYHQNLAEQDYINQWNAFFIQLWDFHEELLLVRMGNAQCINVVILNRRIPLPSWFFFIKP